MTEAHAAREITITRVFDAPRELVWKEWTERKRLSAWWGARGWSAPPGRIEMDVRPGGVFRVVSVSEEDGTEIVQEGVYQEVVEPERLVIEESAESAWHGGATTVIRFSDLGYGRTEMVFRTTIWTTEEGLDAAAEGLADAFDRLAERLA